ncbi:MAG: energy-coupling factor transporter ATPase, partial [Oscillospiraceae bacterium]|nr:energy-coupling factor transporter ATPase [Oscillospiraceae bacterium]
MSFDKVSFAYETESQAEARVLDDIDLLVNKGEFVAVLGYNGSGKSTLAKHMNAILIPLSGKVEVHGMDTADEALVYDIRQKVGMVFQNPDNQIVATVVEEDVAFALENLGVEPNEIRRRVDEALDIVGMSGHATATPHQLSGGQKQRVAIAGVIAMRPDCIVLDEPTAMLDPKGRQTVLRTVRRLNVEYGITVVFITHYMEEAAAADRVVILSGGKIAKEGTPKQVFSDVEGVRALGLDVPQATEICYLLRGAGVDIERDIVLPEECVAQLSR